MLLDDTNSEMKTKAIKSNEDNKIDETKEEEEKKDEPTNAKDEQVSPQKQQQQQQHQEEFTDNVVAEQTKTKIESVEVTEVAEVQKSDKVQDQKIKTPTKDIREVVEKPAEPKMTLASFSTEGAEAFTSPSKEIPEEKEEVTELPLVKPATKHNEQTSSTKANKAAKPNSSEAPKESTEAITSAPAVTPVKKQARTTKATAKVKANSNSDAATSSDTKTPEKSSEEKLTPASSGRVKRKSKSETTQVTDSTPSTPKDDESDRKSKRHRLKTILYQSPLPELAFITKLSASEASNSPKPMSNEDRLIVFYKNEYMAVRNAEGTFYLCQTMQNVYRTSPRISIRWLSEDPKDSNVYIPDFYDHTDIECVLTTVELKRIDKGHMRLPKTERTRIESILKKAIDVEKGIVPRPELTEENPDGRKYCFPNLLLCLQIKESKVHIFVSFYISVDISLFKDESQIEKKSLSVADGETGASPGGVASSRKSRRSNTSTVAKPAAQTPSMAKSAKKRKRSVGGSATATSTNTRKSPAKKRKTLVKRKKKRTNHSDDEDGEETSDEFESDTEYKPTQKRTSVNASASKTTPRAQRSPLAKARAASPITPTTSRSRNVPQKVSIHISP